MRWLVGAGVTAALLGVLFVGLFLGALDEPRPHRVPIGVVAPAPVVAQLGRSLDDRAPGAFDLRRYGDEKAGRAALLGRKVDGVLVVAQGRLIVASAAGRTTSTVITQTFQGVARAQGRALAVEDAAPLPPGDPGGVTGVFYVLALLVPGVAIGVLLGMSGLDMTPRLTTLVLGSLGVGLGEAWLADVAFGVLPGRLFALTTVSAGIVLTIGLVVMGMLRALGFPGVGIAALLFFPIGLLASGGPSGPRFVPEWYAGIGRFLPVGAGSDAVRDTVFFDGAALGVPLAVLGGWALLGAVLLTVPAPSDELEGTTETGVLTAP